MEGNNSFIHNLIVPVTWSVILQGEKRKMLMEHETQKIKEMDDQYQGELREWKAHLRPRKQVSVTIFRIISWNQLIPDTLLFYNKKKVGSLSPF